MADELTEEELCELAEINNQLTEIVFRRKPEEVTEKEILWLIYLELQGLIDQISYTHFDEKDEVIPPKSKKETSRPDDFRG